MKLEQRKDYVRQLYQRPEVPPETLYPLLRQAYASALSFVGIEARLWLGTGRQQADTEPSSGVWETAVTETSTDWELFRERVLAIQTVRVSDAERDLLAVQILAEYWLSEFLMQLHGELVSTVSMMRGDEKRSKELRAKSKESRELADSYKPKHADALQKLQSGRPDQFRALGLTENELIELGVLEDPVP